MASETETNQSPVSPDLLEILRDPQAIQEGVVHGPDPGRLEVVRGGYWLVSADTGYKYPVRDGIPVMLIEEGARWKDTPVDSLPVPPPAAEPPPATRSFSAPVEQSATPDYRPLIIAIAAIIILLVLVGMGRRKPRSGQEPPPEV
jgi:uncharacterized protein YbaR (Trm112 family)